MWKVLYPIQFITTQWSTSPTKLEINEKIRHQKKKYDSKKSKKQQYSALNYKCKSAGETLDVRVTRVMADVKTEPVWSAGTIDWFYMFTKTEFSSQWFTFLWIFSDYI